MIKITVPALPVNHRKGTSLKSGAPKPFDFHTQTIYCHTADQAGQPLPFPEKSEIFIDSAADAFAPGEYTLSPNSLYVDRQGNLSISPKLVPLKPRAA